MYNYQSKFKIIKLHNLKKIQTLIIGGIIIYNKEKMFKIKKRKIKEGKYHKKNNNTSTTIKKQSFTNTGSIITDNEYEITSEINKETYK